MRTQVGENPHYCIRRTLNKKTTQKPPLHHIKDESADKEEEFKAKGVVLWCMHT